MSSLILSGWAQPADALRVVADGAKAFDYSAYATPEESFAGLAKLGDVESVVAWSLGGQLAVRAIMEGVIKPKHLTLIAAPVQFVSNARIKGMDPLTNEQFMANYGANPTRTKARFHALVAKGDVLAEQVMAQLQHHPQVEDTRRWLPWLDVLTHYSLLDKDLGMLPPTLIVHGMEDAIVPVTQSEILVDMLPLAQLNVWNGTAHAPHLHDAARLKAQIAEHQAKRQVA